MPAKRGKDSNGCYYQWGDQKKYYYECGNVISRNNAKNKADKQGRAIQASGGEK